MLAAVPFHCHERLGWTPDKDGYEFGGKYIQRAADTLMAAPGLIHNSPDLANCVSDCTATGLPSSIFDGEREIIGRDPICRGWKKQVAHFAGQGWYKDKSRFHVRRQMAKDMFNWMDELIGNTPEEKAKLHEGIAGIVKWFVDEMKAAKIDKGELFERGKS